MARWRVVKEWNAEPSSGIDRDAAYALKLSSNGEEAQTTVEWAAPSRGASASAAREAVRPYLESEKPPRRLLLNREGGISVIEQ
jgi:hypothetical protein